MPYIRTARTLRHRRISASFVRGLLFLVFAHACHSVRSREHSCGVHYLLISLLTVSRLDRRRASICTYVLGKAEDLVAPIDIWVFAKDF
ncbi:hypothetical protein EV715DRAFT_245479, partial [Schizophyllum commune]